MKKIILVRHAKAVSRKVGKPDFVRSLIKKGRKQADSIARKIEKIKPDLIISSPAKRALETAQIFAKYLKYPKKKIIIKHILYNGGSDRIFIDIIKELDNKINTIAIFGHDPIISDFASFLCKDFNEPMPTSATLIININKENWNEIAHGVGEVSSFKYPKQILKYYKGVSNDINKKIFEQMMKILKQINAGVAEKNEKVISKWSHKITNEFIDILKKYKLKASKKADKKK